ncbi:RHS repeat domain-containing protein [Vandammella animalimorsus]|uniref:Teneurin-like YD-shell domain-containing protein n=1 Tax=Vandammella animalimorsus TaxID=2029117 RepID=A0A2A2AMW1_9BURK|nr:RHS repeat-associated core domain-containing protein [Vandammella animalimorsus]PAT39052.1 hypothetical protein CK621_14980 [Vandammella animalimorsus]
MLFPIKCLRYHYDPKGRRIAKTTGQGSGQTTTWYVYAEEGLIAEINEQGQTQKSYGWEPDSPWGTKILWQADHGSGNTTTNAKTYHYIHSDHLGTPQIATDKNGNQTWAQVSEAFGKATISANASTEINIRFPGQYYDKETGTHYNFHRDYDPSTGRYLQSDPIGLDGGINLFNYLESNPIISFDSRGLSGECSWWRKIVGWCDPTKLPKKICDKVCSELVDSCKRALGPQCYLAGTPCLYPCEKMGAECEERKRQECNTNACLPPGFDNEGGGYA